MDGLGLWLGEGRAIYPECSTSLKSKNLHGDYKAIRAYRAGLYCSGLRRSR